VGPAAPPPRGSGGSSRRGAQTPPVRRYRAERSSPARATLLIVGGLLVLAAVVVAVVLSLGGGSNGAHASSTGAAEAGGAAESSRSSSAQSSGSSSSGTAAVDRGQTSVVVLNGTSTTGLAHRISGELQQRGFTKATALDGKPPGANQVTVVEYTSGHHAAAESVAHTLGVTQAQPIEGTVASLAGSATVVVIVGLDKAATSP
jgi:hypothetical protein